MQKTNKIRLDGDDSIHIVYQSTRNGLDVARIMLPSFSQSINSSLCRKISTKTYLFLLKNFSCRLKKAKAHES